MNIVRITAPALEPLTVAETISHLRLDSSNLEPTPDAPTVALAGLGVGNVDNGVHRYRLSFVTATGETDGGEISAPLTVVNNALDGRVALSNLSLGSGNVIARKIYRTKVGADAYFLVGTVNDNFTATFTDNIADANLGIGIQLNNSTSNPELALLIQSAREIVEEWLRRSLISQKWRLTLDCFPGSDVLPLPRPNLISVDSVTYRDFGGTWNTLDAAIYTVDSEHLPARLLLNYAKLWPFTYPQRNSVKIEYTTGYGPAANDVPAAIRQALKILVAELYENREMLNIGNIVNEMPTLKRLLWPFRYQEFF